MKIHEILAEAIEPKREHFRKVLADNKEKLQKSRTRLGVIKNLRRMFPDIKFKMFADQTAAGRYMKSTKVIKVYNHEKLFSGKNVRNNWEGFVEQLEDTLTHETIHKDQYALDKRDQAAILSQKWKKRKSSKKGPKYHQRWMDLNADLDDLKSLGDTSAYKEKRNQINNLVRKAKKDGIFLQTSARDYLGSRTETTAFAEQAAEDLLRAHRGYLEEENIKASKEKIRRDTIKILQQVPRAEQGIFSTAITSYIRHFEKNEKELKQFYKQVIRYIEMKTQ